MICFIDRLFYRYMTMYEYNTLDASVYDETDFWTIRSYYFQIPPLVSLTDVLMTLLIDCVTDAWMCEYNTLDASVCVETDFWIVQNYYSGFLHW